MIHQDASTPLLRWSDNIETQRRIRWIVIAASVLLVFITISFPAGLAYRWFSPPELRLNGIEGSIWNGAASEGAANNLYLRNVEWQFKPLNLFFGKLAFRAQGELAGGSINTDVAVSRGGAVTFSDVQGRVSLLAFQDSFQLQGFDGFIDFKFSRLKVVDGIPVEAVGSVSVENLSAQQLSSAPIGSFRANFRTDNEGISGEVSDEAGVLNIDGSIKLGSDRSYSIVGQVAARPQAPPRLQQQIQYLGSADAQGRREFRIEGQL